MPLNFNPPQDLINAYINRPQPAEIANQGIQQALQTYAAAKQQQQANQLAQQQKDIEMAKGMASNGQDFMDAYNNIVAARTQAKPNGAGMSPVAQSQIPQTPGLFSTMPTQPANFQPQEGGPGLAVNPSGSPIINHFQSLMGNQPGGPTPPAGKPLDSVSPLTNSPLTDPLIQEYQKDPVAYKKQHGPEGMAKLKTQAELDKLLQDKNANAGGPKTLEAILADRVRNGEMTLDQAIQKQAEAAGLKTTGTETAKNTVKVSAEKPSARASLTNTQRELDNMIAQAEAIKNDPDLGYATGWAGTVAPKIPSTGARRVSANIETLKAKTLLNVLASLKELSSSGASGFGQLSNIEGENIRNSIASLDTKQSSQDFKNNLNKIIQEIKSKKSTLETKFNETYGNSSGQENVQTQNAAPETKVVNGQTFVKQNGQWYHQ